MKPLVKSGNSRNDDLGRGKTSQPQKAITKFIKGGFGPVACPYLISN